MAERKTIGAGWIKSTDHGEYVALSFKADEIRGIDLSACWVSLVINTKKAKPTHPDYNITASPKDAQPQKAAVQQKSAFPRPKNFAPQSSGDGDPGF